MQYSFEKLHETVKKNNNFYFFCERPSLLQTEIIHQSQKFLWYNTIN
jgi:hypothetical protein